MVVPVESEEAALAPTPKRKGRLYPERFKALKASGQHGSRLDQLHRLGPRVMGKHWSFIKNMKKKRGLLSPGQLAYIEGLHQRLIVSKRCPAYQPARNSSVGQAPVSNGAGGESPGMLAERMVTPQAHTHEPHLLNDAGNGTVATITGGMQLYGKP
jgi:hypothetical protein